MKHKHALPTEMDHFTFFQQTFWWFDCKGVEKFTILTKSSNYLTLAYYPFIYYVNKQAGLFFCNFGKAC